MDICKLLDLIEKEYLPRARWWPWKNTTRKINLVDYDQYNNSLFFLIESSNHMFQLPLVRVNAIPNTLRDRGFCIESDCFVEAEYTEFYLYFFYKLSKSRFKLVDEKVATVEVYRAEPITLESTNAISLYESNIGRIVLKSYRLLPEVNLEVKILERLTELRYRYIPRIHGFLYYNDMASGILLMDYIKGKGDGGAPFYQSFARYLSGDELAHERGLSVKLGAIVGGLHIFLNEKSMDSFFGVEEVSEIDVSKWTRRLHRMYNNGLKRLDKISYSLDRENREEIDYWRSVVEQEHKIVYDAISKIDKHGNIYYKARTHQDLHLAQMIYTGDRFVDFVITDFEGEPGRSSEE
ncbi:MAG: alpha-amylase, partial [Desulfurococcaceae archaeon]